MLPSHGLGKPLGNGPFGHSDLAGLHYQWAGDAWTVDPMLWGGGTWEFHALTKGQNARPAQAAYWAIGGRCAR